MADGGIRDFLRDLRVAHPDLFDAEIAWPAIADVRAAQVGAHTTIDVAHELWRMANRRLLDDPDDRRGVVLLHLHRWYDAGIMPTADLGDEVENWLAHRE